MIAKDTTQQQLIRESGRRLFSVLTKLGEKLGPGITGVELDEYAQQLIAEYGDTPAFLNYRPDGAPYPFPAAVCVSINDEVVHGIPKDRAFAPGDLVTLDAGLIHNGFITDMARTFFVGKADPSAKKLMDTTRNALAAGVSAACAGNTVGDIGHAIQQHVGGSNFSLVRILGGHGVGEEVHEEPFIPNYGTPGTGPKLVAGMVLALEPIVTEGKGAVSLSDDGYTYFTKDGSRAAHFEDTIVITKNGPAEVLTRK